MNLGCQHTFPTGVPVPTFQSVPVRGHLGVLASFCPLPGQRAACHKRIPKRDHNKRRGPDRLTECRS